MKDAETIRLSLYVTLPTVEDFRTLCAVSQKLMFGCRDAGYGPLISARIYPDDVDGFPEVLWLGHEDNKNVNSLPLTQFIRIEAPSCCTTCDDIEHSFCLTKQTSLFHCHAVSAIYLLIVLCMEHSYLFIENVRDCPRSNSYNSLSDAVNGNIRAYQRILGAEFSAHFEYTFYESDTWLENGIIRGEECAVVDMLRESISRKITENS